MIKPVRTPQEYRDACDQLARMLSASPGQMADSDSIELLAMVVREFERKTYALPPPDPIDALMFRMEQQQLSPRELIPYLGSRSKVSEVLSRTRPLTLPMIRALHDSLGIPANVLIRETEALDEKNMAPEWSQFPRKEMAARKWISGSIESVKEFFDWLPSSFRTAVLYRKSKQIRSARKLDMYALAAWVAQVAKVGMETVCKNKFNTKAFDEQTIKSLIQLSVHDDGPNRAQVFLANLGLALVIEPNLPHTYLDGAAILAIPERPVIGLTLRYDRIDSFWFTLMHELGHILLHSGKEWSEFLDDLDLDAKEDLIESEADNFAGEALIPSDDWKKSPASRLRSPEALMHLANKLSINPAIVAGRMRHEWKAFRLFSNLVGHHQVRRCFPTANWSE